MSKARLHPVCGRSASRPRRRSKSKACLRTRLPRWWAQTSWKQFGRVLLAPGEDAFHVPHFAGAIGRLAAQPDVATTSDALDAIYCRVPEAIAFHERDQQIVKKTVHGICEKFGFLQASGSAEFVQFDHLSCVETGDRTVAAFAPCGNFGEKIFSTKDSDVGSFLEHRFQTSYIAPGVFRADKSRDSMGKLPEQF